MNDDLKRRIKEGTAIPWWERAQLEADFHKEKVKQNGTPQVGRPDSLVGKRGWAIKDSAMELGLSVGFLCEDLQLSREIHSFPELKEMSRENALKTLKARKKEKKVG